MSFLEDDQRIMEGAGRAYSCDPDAVVSLAAYVSREWGYGARILRVVGLVDGGAIAECRHSDGSSWFVGVDRWCNDRVHADHAGEVCSELYRLSVRRFEASERANGSMDAVTS